MTCKEWREGYAEGFQDGYFRARVDLGLIKVVERKEEEIRIPDGLSYEEIYGSVVYQQNKKKEE